MKRLLAALLFCGASHGTPVIISEFNEISPDCAACAAFGETRALILQRYGDKVQVVFKHFPLPQTPKARLASEAALCVRETGGDRFWKFVNVAMREASLDRAAKAAGVPLTPFQKCVREARYAGEVRADAVEGERLGVTMVPTAVVEGKIVPANALFSTLDRILKPVARNEETDLREGTPPDVLSYFDEVENCAHWSNEEPYDKDHLQQAKVTCSSLKKSEGELRAKYKGQGGVMKKLERFDELTGAKEYFN